MLWLILLFATSIQSSYSNDTEWLEYETCTTYGSYWDTIANRTLDLSLWRLPCNLVQSFRSNFSEHFHLNLSDTIPLLYTVDVNTGKEAIEYLSKRLNLSTPVLFTSYEVMDQIVCQVQASRMIPEFENIDIFRANENDGFRRLAPYPHWIVTILQNSESCEYEADYSKWNPKSPRYYRFTSWIGLAKRSCDDLLWDFKFSIRYSKITGGCSEVAERWIKSGSFSSSYNNLPSCSFMDFSSATCVHESLIGILLRITLFLTVCVAAQTCLRLRDSEDRHLQWNV